MLAAPTTLAAFAAVVHAALPPTAGGVRVAGDPDQPVRRVAVCGGSGADVLAAATTLGADVVVTSDLKHHNAGEHLADGGPALVDVAHWASEWPWLSVAADLLLHDLAVLGVTVGVHVSRIVTDPWTARL
jgi:putative NIF3 family GTP cyclohydrolase 1 type 2